MSKPLLFYLLNEWTDEAVYFWVRGLKPCKIEEKTLDNELFIQVVQYTKGGYVYDVFDGNCYNGHMITLMRLPKLSYEELLQTVLTSRHYDERMGAMGIILKEHLPNFEQYLMEIIRQGAADWRSRNQVKRLLKVINELSEICGSVRELDRMHLLCEQLDSL